MPKALETREQIDQRILAVRRLIVEAEDRLDEDTALRARVRLDELFEARKQAQP
jgi:hypothetical protein